MKKGKEEGGGVRAARMALHAHCLCIIKPCLRCERLQGEEGAMLAFVRCLALFVSGMLAGESLCSNPYYIKVLLYCAQGASYISSIPCSLSATACWLRIG